MAKIHIPPTINHPAPLFAKAYIDTMYMPPSHGYRYIVQARCSLTAWVEYRLLRVETQHTLGQFIFEELLCRWGTLTEIVTDNGTPFIAALDYLSDRYNIRHIRISPYNSQANGIVERSNLTIRDSIVKACEGNIKRWPIVAPHIFWADRVTMRRSTGQSPFYMAHGVEPILPFDITHATYLVPKITTPLSTSNLIALRARQLEKRDEDLAKIAERVTQSRYSSIRHFEQDNANRIYEQDFEPGTLVLVRNKKAELIGGKTLPRYYGPMVVVGRRKKGSYTLSELDGSISSIRYAPFRLVIYHPRDPVHIPVTQVIDLPSDSYIPDVDEELPGDDD